MSSIAASEVLIRPATHADAEAMHSICSDTRHNAAPDHHPITGELYQGYEEQHQNWLRMNEATGMNRLHDYIEGQDSGALIKCDKLLALVAELNRVVVGYALARYTVNWATEYRGTMLRIGFESLGIGSMLEEVRYEWANRIGETIFVQTASASGHNFLARNGFYPYSGFRKRSCENPVHYMPFFKNPEHKANDMFKMDMIPLPEIPDPINLAVPDDSKFHSGKCCLVL